MTKPPVDASNLRREAEARLAASLANREKRAGPVDPARLIHELQVHQIEMEMQGEALRQANLALEESHNRYQDLYELAPVGYLTLTRLGLIHEINLTGAAMLGIVREKMIRKYFSEFIFKDDGPRWQQFFKRIFKQGGSASSEFKLVSQGTTECFVRLDCLAVRREPENFVVHVAMIDIGELKHSERRLREQEQLFRMITERIDGYVAVLDLNGTRIYNSPSYQKLLGENGIAGTSCFVEIHPEDRERVMQAFAETVATGIGQHLEYRFVMPDGGIRIMESRGGVARDENGKTRYVVVLSNDITERNVAEQKIHHLAFYDALTGLPNRLTLNDRLQQAMSASKRSGHFGALMFLDLDHFKPLNDHYGHSMGDRLLIQVAQRISACVREIDTVARFGGDEFVVVLGELNVDLDNSMLDTRAIAEKIRAALAEPYLLPLPGHEADTISHQCTASIGIVLFMNHDQSEEEVLKLADIAMYRAKESGRNGIHFYGADFPTD